MPDVARRRGLKPRRVAVVDVGRLAKGAPADLVLFDPDRAWRVDVEAFHSKSKNSPFDERSVKGRALRTVVGGRAVYRLES